MKTVLDLINEGYEAVVETLEDNGAVVLTGHHDLISARSRFDFVKSFRHIEAIVIYDQRARIVHEWTRPPANAS